MKRPDPLLVIILLLCLLIVFLVIAELKVIRSTQVCIGNRCIDVEVANTPRSREIGLMNRTYLDGGMLFVFDTDVISTFWMKDTLIPLDIIWINSDMRIVHIENAVPCIQEPCKLYKCTMPAKYVLEVNSGWANKTSVSDTVRIPLAYT